MAAQRLSRNASALVELVLPVDFGFMSMWTELGFRANPYSTTPIPPTAEGADLLVGRHRPLTRLVRGITSTDTSPTIEGDNGVGKTSLVSVATYMLREKFRTSEIPQLFLPLAEPLQLVPGDSLDDFQRRVYYAVAKAFIEHGAAMKGAGLTVPDYRDVERWLQAPLAKTRSAGMQIGGTGLSGGTGIAVNDGGGFRDAGFRATVDGWLDESFPTSELGGFICLLDNLELLETSQTARQQLEALRDPLIERNGLRWILCGARGIVRSAASSARLNGVLSEPIELRPIAALDIVEVVRRRLDAFSMTPDAYAPVEPGGFQHIYAVLNSNLRDAMKFCNDFALWIDEENERPASVADKQKLLESWLADRAQRHLEATTSVKARAWQLFDDLVSLGGSCSPSDYETFGFNSPMAMRPHVKDLEEANVVISSVADADQRRKHIALTSRGWLVNYQRSGYQAPISAS